MITSYETEINYIPIEIELDPQQISKHDLDTLLAFITEPRKRLFLFKIPGDQSTTEKLAFTARRSVLSKTAETILKSTSSRPKINPLKQTLSSGSSSIRAGIQIQKSFVVPKQAITLQDAHQEHIEQIVTPDLVLIPVALPELPVLSLQLNVLGISALQDTAALKIKEHPDVFMDGIIPKNLPKGFYIDEKKHALCYTDTPHRLPSALAPALEKTAQIPLPSIEQAKALLPAIPERMITLLLNTQFSTAQKNALLQVLPTHSDEVTGFLNALRPANLEFIVPFLAKLFILGGETHASLATRLLNTCLNKRINLDFLKNPEAQNAFFSTRGIKNLQKLASLPAEQKEWWNSLVMAHLSNDQRYFDFNAFFEAYTQIFLPRIAEKNLTLPNPCPIQHNGHLLITLNRVLDVLEHAENPQEQCLTLGNLNWGPTGVHYAMTKKPESERFKQVASCMNIERAEDTIINPAAIYQNLQSEQLSLEPWLFRYMGQHWKSGIRLTDIRAQLEKIQQLTWPPVQKNQLIFILTTTFSDKSALSAEQWQHTLTSCIHLLQTLNQNERKDLLKGLSRCFQFKPHPSLVQIKTLIEQCIELKTAFPEKNFKNELISPLISCLKHEGYELFNILQERIQKTDPMSEENQFSLTAMASYTAILQINRQDLHPDFIKLLAKLDEPQLTQTSVDNLISSFKTLHTKKGADFHSLVLNTLSQINISKSQPLPNIDFIQKQLATLSDLPDIIPVEHGTFEKQETWFKNLIIDKNLFPGCVFGNGDISKLDDLIVDALVDAVKKRSAALRVDRLKSALQRNLQNFIVPQQLRDQLNVELIPLFDALNELVLLLQSPNPKFPEVIEKFRYFEEKKPILLEGLYGVGILGRSKGEYLLSFLLTGKRSAADNMTGSAFATVLSQLHGLFVREMTAFFDNPQNRTVVKDLDVNTSLSWMAAFNETHSLTFLFKEELVEKKVLPALKKTLQQLNTQDPDFEKSILDAAAELAENAPADQALQSYKNKIEAIANYLNLLIDIKDHLPEQFNKLYKQLNTGALARINYTHKQMLVSKLIKAKPESLDLYLKLTTQALEENPEADNAAIARSINGLVTLFNLSDLEPETEVMFFKMSMVHNLKNPSPFPLAALNELKKSALPEETKSLIIKQLIQILSRMPGADSPELVNGLVQQIQLFLTQNPAQASLCIALLQRVSRGNLNQDLAAYPNILQQLTALSAENKEKLAVILTGLASRKKDDTVNLSVLLEITKGLARRSSADIDQVLQLFTTPPYPIAQNLNSALLAHDSEKLKAYCSSFDTNPFAKTGEERDLKKHFATDRIQDALLSLTDLIDETELPHTLRLQFAKQLTFIEILGYTDPLNPNDFQGLKKLTASSRHDLKTRACTLLQQLRSKTVPPEQLEVTQLELLAYLREIYFRTTGLFPNTTQMLVLLLALHDPSLNLLMRIKTGEGKSINTPMLSVLQWMDGGTVAQWTANPTLLIRDYENNCEPFFKFLDINSTLIQSDSPPEAYRFDSINCSTIEDIGNFYQTAKELKKEALILNDGPTHVVLDECDNALLDQLVLYKLVAEHDQTEGTQNNAAQWIYPLAYQFINLPAFRNTDPTLGPVWDEDEDLEQFRLFLNKEVNEKFNGDAEKQNFLMAASNTQLMQWIHASCIAATQIENKHFIVQPVKVKDETGNEITKKIVCVPLMRSTPKTGSIFIDGVQQALQARLMAERPDQAHYFVIDAAPPVLASISARSLIKLFQNKNGRLIGISATPGDNLELKSLATQIGTQAIGIAPYAGDKRKMHPPVFTFSREESIRAICNAIDSRKLPITNPRMEINADVAIQTYEEREAFIARTNEAIEEWSLTQTQPILIINEDFSDATDLEASLETYKREGFKVQIVTGKETQEELQHIIKQAGRPNTITVGTAMLATGIDINTGDHPRGLIVIQPYTDTERMTTQIAGRAARNGKPGEWLPIYQINPPQTILEKILYYIFPWYRQRMHEHAVETTRNKIKLQATVDRIYTQSIDEVQQTLMQQIQAWENLLLELNPSDYKLQLELYQWRETILSELSRSQETSISQETLEASITQFKNSACRLWETLKEEKWAARAAKATHLTEEQSLKLNYLKQLDLSQELDVQAALQQKNKSFTAGAKALMHQNLETMILDKAGVALEYTNPTEEEREELKLAQCKQLLPNLIGAFCAVYPQAISQLVPPETAHGTSFLPEMVTSIIRKVIEKKNQVLGKEEQQHISRTVIQFFQKELATADSDKIKDLLDQLKQLLLLHCEELSKTSLVEQFKMQGLILTFCTLYQNSGLPEDPQLTALKTSYSNEIMQKLSLRLLDQLAWVKQSPQPLHAYFERGVAKEAAHTIYDLAEEVRSSPNDAEKIHALYIGLQEQRVILKDKYLFSIGHSSPRNVINEALNAIDSLNSAPHCDQQFRVLCHDNALCEYHLAQFRDYLCRMSPASHAIPDPVWEHLKNTLIRISNRSKNNQSHLIQELHKAVERFATYEAYRPYQTQLKALNKQLTQSIETLKNADGLKQDVEENLLKQKTVQIATLLQVDANQVRIQSGTDGLQSFIELQIENAPLKEGFTGYQSSFFTKIEAGKTRQTCRKSTFEESKQALLDLSDLKAIEVLPPEKQAAFKKLFELKALLDLDWSAGLEHSVQGELPECIQSKLRNIEQLKQWDWTLQPVEFDSLCIILEKNPEESFMLLLERQSTLNKEIQQIRTRLIDADQEVLEQKNKISIVEDSIKTKETRLKHPDCGYLEAASLRTQILAHKTNILYLKYQLTGPEGIVNGIKKEEDTCQKKLNEVNQLLDTQRKEFVVGLTAATKQALAIHLQDESKKYVDEMKQELHSTDTTIEVIEKTELKKSRYQTRRFFNPTELLRFEAKLAHEEELIPQGTRPQNVRDLSCAQESREEDFYPEAESSLVF
nr:helicase-related protein [Legionella maioricensis]